MTDQEKFERLMLTLGDSIAKWDEGDYISHITARKWEVYLAAKQESAAEIAELKKDKALLDLIQAEADKHDDGSGDIRAYFRVKLGGSE